MQTDTGRKALITVAHVATEVTGERKEEEEIEVTAQSQWKRDKMRQLTLGCIKVRRHLQITNQVSSDPSQ